MTVSVVLWGRNLCKHRLTLHLTPPLALSLPPPPLRAVSQTPRLVFTIYQRQNVHKPHITEGAALSVLIDKSLEVSGDFVKSSYQLSLANRPD